MEEILKTPEFGADGQEKKHAPTFESYYQRLATKRPAPNNPSQSKRRATCSARPANRTRRDESVSQEDSNLPSGVRESAEALNKLFDPDSQRQPVCPGPNTEPLLGYVRPRRRNRCRRSRARSIRSSWTIIVPWWTELAPARSATPGICSPLIADAPSPAWNPAAGLPSSPSSAPPSGLEAQTGRYQSPAWSAQRCRT